jgi:potassium-transporting ATPase KdpC subunit
VTSSGSGLDPNISIANALLQLHRVATARNVSDASVRTLIDRHTSQRPIGFLGDPVVNVVMLNLDLDAIAR